MIDNDTNDRGVNRMPAQAKASAPSKDEREKSRKKKRILLVLLLLLLLTLGTCTAARFLGGHQEETPINAAIMPELDANAEDIADREALEGAMQKKADASYFSLQVNPDASFSAQTGEGRFELINPVENAFPISFDITLDESGKTVYQSGAVLPGKQIKGIALDAKLDPGSYQATVNVLIYSQETEQKEGETQVKITLHVE